MEACVAGRADIGKDEGGMGRLPARELSLLLYTSGALGVSLDLPVVMQIAIDSAVDVLGLESGAIYLLEDGELVLGATTPPLPPGFPEEFRRAPRAGHAHIDQCLAEQDAVFVSDTATADLTSEERAVVDARRLRSILYVPLIAAGEAVGVIIVGTQTRVHAFGAHDSDLCRILGHQIALALTNARLVGQLRQANEELEMHRTHLEELVEQRTRELAAANAELDAVNEELQAINQELTATNEELHSALDEVARTNAELEEATQAKSRFLANMSHELRTPLNSVIGFASILLQGLAGPLNEEQRRQIAMIADSGRQLLALVDDVLDLSKIEAGKVTVVVRDFDAAALVRQVVESSRPLAAEKGLDLVAVAPDGPFMMRSDSGRVRQILLNLVGNAIKFTERGRIEVGLAHNGDDAVFSVTDTGRGISPRDVRRIFDAFVQVGDDAEPKAEGTGLGLALAREYAVLLGGSIEVESEPGVGSTFTVRLPRRAAEPAER
jgi:signal transduction histidine kinase